MPDERSFCTIGHGARPLAEFIALLKENGADLVADVRTVPRSRHNPQYNRETLPAALAAQAIGYVHLAGLGGLRRPRRDSPNAAWRNASFRGYADYMQTPEFAAALQELIDLAGEHVPAIMCAETVPWRCHRSLISDALLVRGYSVCEIISNAPCRLHKLTPWAAVEGTTITYPAPAA